jgi:hypothetical protein
MVIPLRNDPPEDPPPASPAKRERRGDAEDRPKVADALIEIRSLRLNLRELDVYRAAVDCRRMQLEERLDRAEMRLVEVVRQLEMKKAA